MGAIQVFFWYVTIQEEQGAESLGLSGDGDGNLWVCVSKSFGIYLFVLGLFFPYETIEAYTGNHSPQWLNRRSQRRSYNWKGFDQLLEH